MVLLLVGEFVKRSRCSLVKVKKVNLQLDEMVLRPLDAVHICNECKKLSRSVCIGYLVKASNLGQQHIGR
jgi:hypothetical protein